MIERNFEVKIKVVQSDSGKEFSFFIITLGALEVTHRITCPHSPTQNGRMKSWNRKVVAMGLALLFVANMFLKFWIYTFYIAIFGLNRSPLKTLNLEIPYLFIYGKAPLFYFR